MEKEKDIIINENISWEEINKKTCEEASLNDMSGWYELD